MNLPPPAFFDRDIYRTIDKYSEIVSRENNPERPLIFSVPLLEQLTGREMPALLKLAAARERIERGAPGGLRMALGGARTRKNVSNFMLAIDFGEKPEPAQLPDIVYLLTASGNSLHIDKATIFGEVLAANAIGQVPAARGRLEALEALIEESLLPALAQGRGVDAAAFRAAFIHNGAIPERTLAEALRELAKLSGAALPGTGAANFRHTEEGVCREGQPSRTREKLNGLVRKLFRKGSDPG